MSNFMHGNIDITRTSEDTFVMKTFDNSEEVHTVHVGDTLSIDVRMNLEDITINLDRIPVQLQLRLRR